MELRRRLARMYRDLDGPLGSGAAARVIVPLLIELTEPVSVLDVGCGVGSFLRELQREGLDDVFGVDAAEFDASLLVVDPARVGRVDLREPLDLGRRFDLVLCFEVGGYLPDHDLLVESLVRHGSIVAFSSAIPWQDFRNQPYGAFPSAWAERFAAHGFAVLDPFRYKLWNDERLPFWFRQNVVLFAHDDALAARPRLATLPRPEGPLDIVHPELFRFLAGCGAEASLRLTVARLPRIAMAKAARLRSRLAQRGRAK